MTGIAKVSEKMKKKISFGDYILLPEAPKVETIETKKEARKIYSLAQEDAQKLEEIFSKRINSTSPSSISEIMSEAIQLLYSQLFFSNDPAS